MMVFGLLMLVAGLGGITVAIIRLMGRASPADIQSPLFSAQTPPPAPSRDWPSPEPDLATRIGQVISNGMDRVDAMRQFGADRFLTFLPMPDGTCWSLTVVHHADEATAKASYQPVPAVTH